MKSDAHKKAIDFLSGLIAPSTDIDINFYSSRFHTNDPQWFGYIYEWFVCPGCKKRILPTHYNSSEEAHINLVDFRFYKNKSYRERVAHRSCFPRTVALFTRNDLDAHTRLMALHELKNANLIQLRET